MVSITIRNRLFLKHISFSKLLVHIFNPTTIDSAQLDLATSGKGGLGIFIGVCIASAGFGAAHGFAQGGMAGDLSLMCPEFIQVSIFAHLIS